MDTGRGTGPDEPNPPTRTGALLRREGKQILERWAAAVQARVPALSEMSRPVLYDHMSDVLGALADWVDGDGDEPELGMLSSAHGIERLSHGVLLRELVTEYRVLRETILRTVADSDPEGMPPATLARELLRLNAGLDYGVTAAVSTYAGLREDAVTALTERLRLAVDAAGIGTWDYDVTTGAFECDLRCKMLFGLPASNDPVTPEAFAAIVHPDDRERTKVMIEAAITAAPGGDYRFEFRTVGNGDSVSERWLQAQGRAFFDDHGRALRLLGTVTEITERKRLDEAREHFLGVLGHDLRNPLNAVAVGAAYLGIPQIDDEKRIDFARRISASVSRMEKLIRDLLDFTRAQVGTVMPVYPRPSNIDLICRKVLDELAMAHGKRRIEYDVDGDPSGEWDAERIEQVVSNLVMNAIKYSPASTPVKVSWDAAGEDGEDVELVVHNEGPAIPRDLLPFLFNPYRMGPEAQHAGGKSMGLGLFIVSEIVRAHGGTVRVTSSEEEGTTFTVRLPRKPPSAAKK